ncbi:protein TORMOZ EMBRYO DEFECTIVE-like [Silene latifolia]|uniref:protein TORMOZ EMBRYO DEFECTIVE-like n=1 Tax=Silene latifolia TaxID=37657 RepID=UPI003D76C7DF
MADVTATLKKSYKCSKFLEQFYSGGPVAVSTDGSFMGCACNNTIKIVKCVSANASIKATLEGDSEAVTALAIAPDNAFLFAATHSCQIMVWDLSSFTRVRSWKNIGEGPVLAMACDVSGGMLATVGADRKVLVWDVDAGYCTHYFKGHTGIVNCILFHPDPNNLVLFSASDDTTVRAWDLVAGKSKQCAATMKNHTSTVVSLAISEDRMFLFSAGRDQVVSVWDLSSYNCKMTILTNEVLAAVCAIHSGTPFYDSLSLNKAVESKSMQEVYFLTAGERGVVRIWEVCLSKQKYSEVTFRTDQDDERRGFTAAHMLPSDQGLLCITADQQFLFYSPLKHSEKILHLSLTKRLIGYNEVIVDMKFVGEDENLLAVATNIEQVHVYDMASMSCSYVLAGHSKIVLCLDTCIGSSGSTYIVTGSKDKDVRLWDSETRKCVGVGIGHLKAVGAVAFSKKQRNFFVSGSRDKTLKVWSFEGLISDSDKPYRLKTKGSVGAHKNDINSVAISPDDSFVCSGSEDRTARLFKLPELVEMASLVGHKQGIWFVEFSPVDPCVLTASKDKTIKLWSVRDHSCLKTFEGHTSTVYRASFISRGAQLVSTDANGLLKLWNVKSIECIATYDQHEDKVWALAIGRKTEMLATGGSDAVINLWNDSTAAEKEEAFRKEEEEVLRGQDLENAISDADYAKAILLAFQLKKPHKLLELLLELYRKNIRIDHVRNALQSLGMEELGRLLEYVREWNTKPKLCHVANSMLLQAFSIHRPIDIDEVKGIGELLEGLIAYSQRHYNRIESIERSLFTLDYTLNAMSVIEPEDVSRLTGSTSKRNLDKETASDVQEGGITETMETKPNKSSRKRKFRNSTETCTEMTKTLLDTKATSTV